MPGIIALVGSGEFLPAMTEVDRYLLGRLRSAQPRVVVLPTAAGQEGPASVKRWSRMGVGHFERLGARAESLPIVDRASAANPAHVERLRAAEWVYFSGGDPVYLHATLEGTPAWSAVLEVLARGGIYAGCSAGAMILGAGMADIRRPDSLKLIPAFSLLPRTIVLPHFDRLESFRPGATARLRSQLPQGLAMAGIDEDTALVGEDGRWQVMGRSGVSLLTATDETRYSSGMQVQLNGPTTTAE